MPKTYVITGGTDGIGAAVARALFARGDHAVVVGTHPQKGERLVRQAGDSPGSATFVPADLSRVADIERTVAELAAAHPVIDGLVLCARYYRTHRHVTADGFEDNFALFYLSRVLLGYGLLDALNRAAHPVIVNVAGPGHDTPIRWEDLQSVERYDGVEAMFMTGRLNDLHGVTFAERHGTGPIRYALFHPGTTATSFAGEFDPPTAAFIEQQRRTAKPATAVAPPILALLDDPPKAALSAYHLRTELDMPSRLFSPRSAARLAEITEQLLTAVRPQRTSQRS
ncbi:SDR family NAD(P)-dependent oxidoreductase [Actinomycetes bacterium KLBMP 9759]